MQITKTVGHLCVLIHVLWKSIIWCNTFNACKDLCCKIANSQILDTGAFLLVLKKQMDKKLRYQHFILDIFIIYVVFALREQNLA